MNYVFISNFNGATVEVWEWISNTISHFTRHVIIYPCWDKGKSMLVKEAPGSRCIHYEVFNKQHNQKYQLLSGDGQITCIYFEESKSTVYYW